MRIAISIPAAKGAFAEISPIIMGSLCVSVSLSLLRWKRLSKLQINAEAADACSYDARFAFLFRRRKYHASPAAM
jgi:hypothetical protein